MNNSISQSLKTIILNGISTIQDIITMLTMVGVLLFLCILIASPMLSLIWVASFCLLYTGVISLSGITVFLTGIYVTGNIPVNLLKFLMQLVLILNSEIHNSQVEGGISQNNFSMVVFNTLRLLSHIMKMDVRDLVFIIDEKSALILKFLIDQQNSASLIRMRIFTVLLAWWFLFKAAIKILTTFVFSLLLILTMILVDWRFFLGLVSILPKYFVFGQRYLRNIIFEIGICEYLRILYAILVSHIRVWVVNVIILCQDIELLALRYQSDKGLSRQNRRMRIRATFNDTIQRLSYVVDTIGLPNYIRSSMPTFDRKGVEDTYKIAEDLGWPVNVKIADPVLGVAGGQFDKEWLMFGTDFKQGMVQRKTYVDKALSHIANQSPEFRRAETFQTYENELKSTARYFKEPVIDFPDISVDYFWPIISDIFRNSQLTPFNVIISAWEKKYALGSFFRDRFHPNRKYRRSKFISDLGGYAQFKKLWARTFQYAPSMVPVSAVFVKGEALPPRKWQNDKLRTVIGSPIFQYIMSTIWNFEANHRFKWETTPIKVGIPLNGASLSGLWQKHSYHSKHYAGDMSDFDSTITGNIQNIIKEVRKKGFENHKDYRKIAKLIDLNYTLVENQLLNTTSNGNVYRKGTGLTTGHSATSADNSLTTVILYLSAWKEITGYSAEEFKFFNELSCYGDDHFLSISEMAPPSWTWNNIVKTLSKWNITMRCEASGNLSKIPFLSKFGRRPTPADRRDFERLQMTCPEWIVYHDKDRLVGKLTARTLTGDHRYRIRRMISYLDLTPHHPDLYMEIRKAIDITLKNAKHYIGDTTFHIPSYKTVMINWYTKETKQKPNPEVDDFINSESKYEVIHYGEVGFLEVATNYIASIPDILNPVVTNSSYTNFIQIRLKGLIDWPLQLLAFQNNILSESEMQATLPRTCYNLLTTQFGLPQKKGNLSSLLCRHWLFLLLRTRGNFLGLPSFLENVALKLSNLNFIINAKLQIEVFHFDIPLWNMTLLALLNFVNIPFEIPLIPNLKLPNISRLWDILLNYIYINLWYYVPPNYKDLMALPSLISPGHYVCISAPTGTGKSTTMINAISRIVKGRYQKIILVQPRSILVKRLVPFLNDTIGVVASGQTRGMVLDKRADVWVMTPQEVLLHTSYLNPDYLFILDEAHLTEVAYTLLKKVLKDYKMSCLYVTATPTEEISSGAITNIQLRMANFFEVVEVPPKQIYTTPKGLSDKYFEVINSIISKNPPSCKTLVFVPDVKMALKYQEKCALKSTCLYSGHTDLPKDWQVIFSTSVSDAGITIPNVDNVISLDIDRRVGVLPNQQNLSPFFIKLPVEILKQRKGRTGRTNNGAFYTISVEGDIRDSIVQDFTPNTADILAELLSFGLDANQLVTFAPDLIIDFLSIQKGDKDYQTDFDRSIIDPILDQYGQNLQRFISNLSPDLAFKQFEESLINNDGSEVPLLSLSARGRFSNDKNKGLIPMMKDMLFSSGKVVSDSFPNIVKLVQQEDIQEKLWDYSNIRNNFNKFFGNTDFFVNDQPTYQNTQRDYTEDFWAKTSDIWNIEDT